MKQLEKILLFIILTSFLACGPIVTFNEPQPINTDNLSKFPKRLQGRYLNITDNSILEISNKLIQRIYDYDSKMHRNQIDSSSRISGDTLIDIETNKKILIKIEGDSIINHIHYVDTVFQLDYDNVLRKYKGYYFINIRYGKEAWEVKKIKLSHGQLTLSNISAKEDIEILKEISETDQDTISPYRFSITKKQFKKFIKNDGFNNSESFFRQ